MRKLIILLILACLNGPFAAAQNPEPVALSDSSSWCMVLIPDPQTYTKFDYNHPTFELMMHWIKQNKRRLNIRLVLCTGDLVEQNQRTVPDGVNGNLPSDKQWQFVSDASSTTWYRTSCAPVTTITVSTEPRTVTAN